MIMNRFPSLSNEGRTHDEHFGAYQGDVHAFNQPHNIQNTSHERGPISGPAFGHLMNINSHQATYEQKSNFRDPSDGPVANDANLYIKNIDYDISDEVLYTIFSKLGEITSHHIVRDAMKRSRGFGFMSYRTIEQAKRAIHEANGMFIGNKPVVVMLHIKKDQRRLQKLVMKETTGNGHAIQPRPGPFNSSYKLQQAMNLYQSNQMQGVVHHQAHEQNSGPFGTMRRSGHGPNSGPLTGPYANQNLRTNGYNAREDKYNKDQIIRVGSDYDLNDTDYGQHMRNLPSYTNKEGSWDGFKSPHPHSLPHQESDGYHRFPISTTKSTSLQGQQRAEQHEGDIFAQRERQDSLQYEQLRSPQLNNSLWSSSMDNRERELERENNNFNQSQNQNRNMSPTQDQSHWLGLGSPSNSISKNSISSSVSDHGSWTTNSSPKCTQPTPSFDNIFSPFPQNPKCAPRINGFGSITGTGYPSQNDLFVNTTFESVDQQLPEIFGNVRRPSYLSIDERIERNYERSGLIGERTERSNLYSPSNSSYSTDSPQQSLSPMSNGNHQSHRSFGMSGPSSGISSGSLTHHNNNTFNSNLNSQTLSTEPINQRMQLTSRLLSLIELQSQSYNTAKKITDYLVTHAPHTELLQLLQNPDLLLSHYIAAAVSKMTVIQN